MRYYEAFNYNIAQPFNIASKGLITDIDGEIWYKYQGPNNWAVIRLVAKQGDSEYSAGITDKEPVNQESSWQRYTFADVLPTDFGKISGSGPDTLDMSSTAPPIYWGYEAFSKVQLTFNNVIVQNSFFDLRITTVPEPTPLLSLGCLALLATAARAITAGSRLLSTNAQGTN